jgi:hypothetical protein
MAEHDLPAEITDGIDPDAGWLSVLQFFVKESEQEAFEKDMDRTAAPGASSVGRRILAVTAPGTRARIDWT